MDGYYTNYNMMLMLFFGTGLGYFLYWLRLEILKELLAYRVKHARKEETSEPWKG